MYFNPFMCKYCQISCHLLFAGLYLWSFASKVLCVCMCVSIKSCSSNCVDNVDSFGSILPSIPLGRSSSWHPMSIKNLTNMSLLVGHHSWVHSCLPSMSCLSYSDGLRDGRQVTIHLLLFWVLLQNSTQHHYVVPSSFFFKHFFKVQVVQPYNSSNTATAWKNLSERLDFHMINNQSITVQALAICTLVDDFQ